MEPETIVAVATPPGVGAIAVIRLSGPDAVRVAGRVFQPAHGKLSLAETPSYRLRHGFVVAPETGLVADEVLVFAARGPRSYTGEDVVEFSCHGGPAPVAAVLDALIQAGARPARPGEFTLRAFLNGRMDLSQAEAVAKVVRARSREGLAAALGELQGKLGRRIRGSAERLVDLLAHLEAALDFDDQEVPPLSLAEAESTIAAVEGDLRELLRDARVGRLYREGLRVVLAGRPNVGKSSLLNALTGRERAIVTEVPGTTRDMLEEGMVVQGVPVVLVDTAGLRETGDRVEAEGVRRAQEALEAASVAVLVLDGSTGLTGEDREALARMPVSPAVVAVNKADLPQGLAASEIQALVPNARLARVSALLGTGLESLWREILSAAGLGQEAQHRVEGRQDALVTSARHEEALRRAVAELEAARGEALYAGSGGEELVAARLRGALHALGEVTGESVDEEVLVTIFSTFCLGK